MILPDAIDSILDPLLRIFQGNLLTRLNGHIAMVYLAGSAEMVEYGKTKGGKPIYFEGPPMQQAIDYAAKHCATLVTGIDDETKKRLAQIIADGIENKRGVPGIARDIRAQFQDMSRYRAKLISQNETADALQQAFMDRAEAMGIEGKEWITAGDEKVCEICGGNEAEGVIPLHQPFSSGDMRPPGHPGGCRCALAPAMLGK